MVLNNTVQNYFVLNVSLRALAIGGFGYLAVRLLATTQLYATALVVIGIAALIAADMARIITRAHRSLDRFVDGLGSAAGDFPIERFAGHSQVVGRFERAINQLNSVRADQQRHAHYLQSLLDTVTAALYVLHADGHITLANRAAHRLAGLAVDRLQDIEALGLATATALMTQAAGTRQIVELADGQQVLAAVAQFSAPNQAPHKLLSLQRITGELDIVELKAWRDMARVLAHEIMNSLTPIASLSESLELLLKTEATRDGLVASEASYEVADAVEAIKRRSNSLMNFVERYREVSELPQPQLKHIHMSGFIAGMENLMRQSFKDKGIGYSSSVMPGELTVEADPELLEQALINLLKNAVDAVVGAENPTVKILCELKDSQLVIAVSDNGHGLSERARDQIFVPFFTTKPNGSGIGLNLARHIALAHQGQLIVRANVPSGMVFSLLLPVASKA